jgi:hypothetical protein
MAVINDPGLAANVLQVGMGAGTIWTPGHVASGPLPVGTGGAYRLSMSSGTMAASLGANSEIFQFRYVTAASRVCLIHGISISAAVLTLPAVSTTVLVGPLAFRATQARGWSVAGSGGTRATMTGDNQNLRTTHATSEVNDIGICTTAALTAGTKTLDAQDIGSVVGSTGVLTAVGVQPQGIIIPKTNLMGDFAGSLAFPVVCANQEGIVVRVGPAFPATMTWAFTIDIAWSEVQGF